jgi:hypothetical protein
MRSLLQGDTPVFEYKPGIRGPEKVEAVTPPGV